MGRLSSHLRLVLPAAFLALAVGCVQQVNFAKNFRQGDRRFGVMYEGPSAPSVSESSDVVEVRFGSHVLRVEKTRVTLDAEVKALDPECNAMDIRITRERIKVLACGHPFLYKLL